MLCFANAHHGAAAEADEREDGFEAASVGPEIQDADFRLGEALGRINDAGEIDPFLQQVMRTLRRRDGVEVFFCGRKVDALSGEGEEGLEDPLTAVFGKAVASCPFEPLVEEDGGRDGGMMEPGEREFAEAVVPVGMAGPFDLEGLAEVEGERDLFLREFLGHDAVVDAVDGHEAGSVAVAEAWEAAGTVFGNDFGDVEDGDAEVVGGEVEVGEGFLMVRIDFEEDYVFGVVPVEDDVRQLLPESGLGMIAEEILEGGIEGVDGAVVFGEQELEGLERWESLQFDEHGLKGTVGGVDEAEVGGHEVWVWSFGGGAEALGDDFRGGGAVVGVGQKLMGKVGSDAGHGFEKFAGEEDGGFSNAEADAGAGTGVEIVEEMAVVPGAEARVEVVAQGGDHADRIRGGRCGRKGGEALSRYGQRGG
jgi:hypothetical protein